MLKFISIKEVRFILYLFFILKSTISALTCDQLDNNQNVPCIEIYHCNVKAVNMTVNLLSNGKGNSKSDSMISLCYSNSRLELIHFAMKQTYLDTESQYKNCNDPIFNSNVAELFIAPYVEEEPHCYNELDISPFDIMFDSGIYNPNLNHSGIQGTTLDCTSSNITYSTTIDTDNHQWVAYMSFPFSLLNCPYNCPNNRYCNKQKSSPHEVYRANIFRINQLTTNSQCNSNICEYMAWNPTLVDPPAFHEPTKFGFFILQF